MVEPKKCVSLRESREEAARMAEIFEKNLFEGDNKPIDKKALKILLFRLQKRG